MQEARRLGMTSGDYVFINWSPSGTVYNSLTYNTGVSDLAKITSGVLLQLVNHVIDDDIQHKFQRNITPKHVSVRTIINLDDRYSNLRSHLKHTHTQSYLMCRLMKKLNYMLS